MVEQLVPILARHGLFYAICNIGAWTQPMVTLYYMNYIVKYIEFIDTVFLVLKHKKLAYFLAYLPPRRYRTIVLHATNGHHFHFVGAYYT